jgi:hypothetical protein
MCTWFTARSFSLYGVVYTIQHIEDSLLQVFVLVILSVLVITSAAVKMAAVLNQIVENEGTPYSIMNIKKCVVVLFV